MKMVSKQRLLKNFIYAIGTQAVSYILSVVTGLVAPKMLDVEQYGFWQLFVFYGTYVNFAMLGIHDGMYLRLGGKEYDSLEADRESSQFRFVMLINLFASFCFLIVGMIFSQNIERRFVVFSVAIYLILANACQYIGEMFQAVNYSFIFSRATLINKIVTLCAIALLLILRVKLFQPYIFALLIATAASLVYYLIVGKKVVLYKPTLGFQKIIEGIKSDAGSGWKIMIGGYAGLLIIGSGRALIDKLWGISTFGKLSMAISLINLALQFINQIAIVLFPAIRTVDQEVQQSIYNNIKSVLHLILPIVYFLYIPLAWFIGAWLPDYSAAIVYLGIILPICAFDAKTNMLNLTYLKVMHREDDILKVNLFSLALNIILMIFAYLVFGNVDSILIAMVASIAIRSLIFDLRLEVHDKKKCMRNDIYDIYMAFCFIAVNRLNNNLLLPFIVVNYILLIIANKSEAITIYKRIISKRLKK